MDPMKDRLTVRCLAYLSASAVLASAASAQFTGIYVDIGAGDSPAGLAPPDYGAANPDSTTVASIPGEWNLFDLNLAVVGTPLTSQPLLDGDSQQTAVTMTWDTFGQPLNAGFADNFDTFGADGNLLDDYGFANGPSEIRFNGLPAGSYEVITYAMAPDVSSFRTSVEVLGSAGGVKSIGSNVYYFLIEPTVLARDITMVTSGGALTIRTDLEVGRDSVNAIQIIPLDGSIPSTVGTNYCGPANMNSTNASAALTASGSTTAATNDLTLTASFLPLNTFGFFIVSQMQGFVANPGGSSGDLCLAGSIGRYVGPGQIQNTGMAGEFSLALDLSMIPQPTGFVAAMSGETWNFQAWYRDTLPMGGATSNLSDGLQIDFQ